MANIILPAGSKTDIPALTGLRGIAALWVFLFHVASSFRQVDPNTSEVFSLLGAAGFLGVDLFFVLSGFVLALNYLDEGTHRSMAKYGGFLWKRIARIYPVHLAALGLLAILVVAFAAFDSFFLPESRLRPLGLFKTLTLTHGWSVPIPRTWNTVSWSISCEWLAYLFFPLIALAASRMRSGLGVFACILGLFAILAWIINTGEYRNSMAYGLPRIAVEFTAGVLLYRLWQLRLLVKNSQGDWVATIALVIFIAGGNLVATRLSSYFVMMVFPVLACAVVYGLASGTGVVCKALSCRAAQLGGHFSYAFYMVHLLILGIAARLLTIFGKTAHTPMVVASVIIAALVATALSAWIYAWIETPARRGMIRWLDRDARRSRPGLPARDV